MIKRLTSFALLAAFVATEFATTLVVPAPVLAAGTPAGTAISNQASVQYTDGNSNSFTSYSNTVTTTVQNVPAVSVVAATPPNTVPGGQYDSVFTVTNTGNGNGNLNLTFPTDTGNDASAATQQNVQIVFPATATIGTVPTGCASNGTRSYNCTASGAATLVSASIVPANASIVVTIPTNVARTATSGAAGANTIVTPLSSTVTYTQANNPNTSATSVTSSTTAAGSTANSTTSVLAEARLDIQKTFYAPGSTNNTSANLEYVISAADGSTAPARDLQSVKTLLGSPAAGILITDKIPAFGSPAVPLAVQSISASAPGTLVGTGAVTSIYSTTNATGASGWTPYSGTGALPTGTAFVGVLVSGNANGTEINGNNGAMSTSTVSPANAQVSITLFLTPPTSSGSGNAGAIVNQADSVIGGNEANTSPVTGDANASQSAVGPNIPAGTADSTTAIDSGTQGVLYPTQAANTTSPQPGASNAVASQANAAPGVYDGPYGSASASGSYNGSAAASTSNDFTAVAYLPPGFVPTNTSATGVVGNAVGATSTVNAAHSIQNVGNAVDNLTVSITPPTGWIASIYLTTNGTTTSGGALSTSSGSTPASYTFANVPSGQTTDTANVQNYIVVYTAPATVTAFSTTDIVNTVTSGNNGTVNNTTHDEIIVGGPLAITKTQAFDSTTCPSGSSVPGCIITYSLQYLNNAPGTCPGTAPTVVPAAAGGYYVKGATITENGATAPNTWAATYTNAAGVTTKVTSGLNASATETNAAIPTTFPTGNTAGSYAFSALVGGSANYLLAPGCTGTVKFAVTVSTS